MPLINVASPIQSDANDGRIVSNPERMGNRRWGQKVFLSGTEQPIQTYSGPEPKSTWQEILSLPDPLSYLSSEGRLYYASDAASADLVTGQTSHATTTPTFLLDVPTGTVAVPLLCKMFQAGTVAGGAVTVIMEFDNAKRYSSGGTSETVLSSRTDNPLPNRCPLYSGATATDAYGVRVAGYLLGQDVSPAEGAVNEVIWTPVGGLDLLVGPASWLVFSSAGTTGPSWYWTFKWASFPREWLTKSA